MLIFLNIIFRNINADECVTFVQCDTLSFKTFGYNIKIYLIIFDVLGKKKNIKIMK